ncbi:Receptor, ligand binding region [Sesbania bispinosa]|nr:Receptor, ligand binding region [Sesbania bispinosa]
MEADFMIRLGDKAHVPIVTFSATSPALASLQSPYFFQIAQDDSAQVKAITTIIQAFGWKEVVLIYIDDSFGEGVIPFLTNALQQAYVRVPYLSVISLSATNEVITGELYKLMTMPTRVFVVHMVPRLGSRLFTLAKQIGMMDQGYVWIVTDGMTNLFSSLNTSVMESMEGVLGVRPYVPRTKELNYFKARWKRKFLRDNPTLVDTNLNVFGIWAYDTTTALAMAVEKVGTTNFGFHVSNSSSNILGFEKFGIAQNGEKLREALLNTRFRGLGGDFNILGGKLQASTYEIINMVVVTGFCIDVFKAVLDVLPYALPYEFIPFAKPDGDTTIIGNRSNYVDFTMPYTESGVTMVVLVKDNRKKNAWAFLKPLTWDLWVTTTCSFIFIGFVVWVLEHRVNNSFRGPPSHQIGTSLWFSFSIMVFSHREKVVSNLGRFVVIVWVFVVLILVQSYTASLTSLLTVEQLRPTVTDVHQLIKNRMNVGYLKGSFVYGILKDLGFQDFQLKIYESPEECNELFKKGSTNGGIDAAFDEVPYVKHFLGTYCSKYVMVEPRFRLWLCVPKRFPSCG